MKTILFFEKSRLCPLVKLSDFLILFTLESKDPKSNTFGIGIHGWFHSKHDFGMTWSSLELKVQGRILF